MYSRCLQQTQQKLHIQMTLQVHKDDTFEHLCISFEAHCSDMPTTYLPRWLEFNVPFQHEYGYIRDEPTYLPPF